MLWVPFWGHKRRLSHLRGFTSSRLEAVDERWLGGVTVPAVVRDLRMAVGGAPPKPLSRWKGLTYLPL